MSDRRRRALERAAVDDPEAHDALIRLNCKADRHNVVGYMLMTPIYETIRMFRCTNCNVEIKRGEDHRVGSFDALEWKREWNKAEFDSDDLKREQAREWGNPRILDNAGPAEARAYRSHQP